MENKFEIEEAAAIINMAIAGRRAIVKSLSAIAEQIDVIDIDQYDYSVHLAQGLDKLANYYGAEIQKCLYRNSEKYDEYFFNVNGIKYFELRKKEGAEVQC